MLRQACTVAAVLCWYVLVPYLYRNSYRKSYRHSYSVTARAGSVVPARPPSSLSSTVVFPFAFYLASWLI